MNDLLKLAKEAVNDGDALDVLVDALIERGLINEAVPCLLDARLRRGLCRSCGSTTPGNPASCRVWKAAHPGCRQTLEALQRRERLHAQAKEWAQTQLADIPDSA